MNRYDYYTRCGCIDEQEWLTEELYYPEPESCAEVYDDYYDCDYYDDCDYCNEYDYDCYEQYEEEG